MMDQFKNGIGNQQLRIELFSKDELDTPEKLLKHVEVIETARKTHEKWNIMLQILHAIIGTTLRHMVTALKAGWPIML